MHKLSAYWKPLRKSQQGFIGSVRSVVLTTQPKPSFAPGLQSGITAVKALGSPTGTLVRATAQSMTDFEGVVRQVPAGCAVIDGARACVQLLIASATLSTQSVTVVAGTYALSADPSSGSVTLSGTGSGTLTGDSVHAKGLVFATTAGTLTLTVSGTVTNALLENLTGATNQNPNDVYVDSLVNYGAGKVGCIISSFLNASTLSSGNLTRATGAKIDSTTCKFAQLPVATDSISTPSKTVTGSFVVTVELAIPTIPPASQIVLLTKQHNNDGFAVKITAAGLLRFAAGNGSATTGVNSTSAVSFAAGTRHTLTYTWTDGVGVSFAVDGVALGTPVALAYTLTDANTTCLVGGFVGTIYRASVGSVYLMNPNSSTGASTWTSATGEVWTQNGSASVFQGTGLWDLSGPIGFQSEGQRINYLGATATPATQTTASLGTGTYTLGNLVGSGSALASGGTATITGAASASAGSPNTFTVTVAGTVTVTVTGTLTQFDLQNGAFQGSYIANTGAAGTSVTRNATALTYQSAGNLNAAQGSIMGWETTWNHAVSGVGYLFGSYVDANNGTYLFHDGTNLVGRLRVAGVNYDATLALPYAAYTLYKPEMRWGPSGIQVFCGGVAGTPNAYTGNAPLASTFQVGSDGQGGNQPFAHIRTPLTVEGVYSQVLSDAKMMARSV